MAYINRISPAKKDPMRRVSATMPTIASKLRRGAKPAPPMVKKQ